MSDNSSNMQPVDSYIRVRTDYYKIVEKPMTDGSRSRQLIKWKYGTIRKDHGRDFANEIPCYDDFIVFPENVNYRQVIENRFWNNYYPMAYKPEPGPFPHIDQLMEHIFGEQKELGYDYLQLLYLQPRQKLPILVLTSKERNTGKSTFMHFLKLWFGDNVTFNSNDDFNSQFNSDWAGVLIVCIDEAMLNKREPSERMKNLSTSPIYKIEAKGKDRVQQEFFAKFVLCSNNTEKPLIIEPGETRYWVRHVGRLDHDDVDFLSKLEKEIPHLMHHLLHERKMSVPKSSRMYFSPKDIYTPALQRIMMNSRGQAEVAIYELCDDIFSSTGEEKLSFVAGDLRLMLGDKGIKTNDSEIRHVLKDIWHLQPNAVPNSYLRYVYGAFVDGNYSTQQAKGRYYTLTKERFYELYNNCRFVDNKRESDDNQPFEPSTSSDVCPF